MLPREYPPWQTVYYHFRRWRRDGRLRRAYDRLREAEGRDRDASAAVIDSQVAKTTPVGGPERGYDGAKRIAGRKRHILVDTSGLVLAARVHGANLRLVGAVAAVQQGLRTPAGDGGGDDLRRNESANAAQIGAGSVKTLPARSRRFAFCKTPS